MTLLQLLRLNLCCWVALANAFVVHSPIARGHHRFHLNQRAAVVEKSTEEWQSILNQEEFRVLREKGTEAPFSSSVNALETTDQGILVCAGCREPLFTPRTKFDSGSGWPSFSAPISSTSVEYNVDFDLILPRTECVCASCGGHLGHVFDDGPQPTGLRYCMNGVSMQYMNKTVTASDDGGVIEQQLETEAAQLPLVSILPSVAVNLGIAALFLNGWIHHEHRADVDPIGLLLENFPLPIAAFYGYSAVKGLLRAKL
eukprot:CAMPEP_0119007540 /NCGR_PEP_ID=MMETSP1176-20130426/3078_1 /TAXON_ID=265551 /ORGANISM="Synedropsis recta cf, Strain CCMP1620" /LENGTH=256 /DNA_ID=CAMNT_0006959711 /DNA_START=22 /DNA_END=792 /DNA_ORIENTATION=-